MGSNGDDAFFYRSGSDGKRRQTQHDGAVPITIFPSHTAQDKPGRIVQLYDQVAMKMAIRNNGRWGTCSRQSEEIRMRTRARKSLTGLETFISPGFTFGDHPTGYGAR
jgi:hypothetical protein